MVEILKYNDDDLKDNEIDEVVTRVRCFILSSKNNKVNDCIYVDFSYLKTKRITFKRKYV